MHVFQYTCIPYQVILHVRMTDTVTIVTTVLVPMVSVDHVVR